MAADALRHAGQRVRRRPVQEILDTAATLGLRVQLNGEQSPEGLVQGWRLKSSEWCGRLAGEVDDGRRALRI